MNKQEILEIAKNDPRFSKAVLTLENQIGDMPITGEGLDELVQLLEFALNNPEQYPEIVASAVKDDMIEEGDLPAQFDPVAIISLLVLLYGMQERTKQKGFARGGLASMGRHGDTMLAHINPREAAMLKQMGGAGTINPKTGYPEYFSLKKFISVALPIALDFIAPGVGTAIGTSLGLTDTAAAMAGSAIIGGGTAALTGGDPLKGALLGGLGAGLGSTVGGAANNAMGLNLGTMGQNVLGNALVGGGMGALTGQGFLKGAASGALGAYAGQQLGDLTGSAALGAGGKQFGNMIAAGYDPKSAIIGGGLAGLATSMARPAAQSSSGLGLKPSDAVVEGLKMPKGADYSYSGVPEAGYGTTNFLTGQMGYKGPENFAVDYSLTNLAAPVAPRGYGAEETGFGLKAPQQSPLGQLKTAGAPASPDLFSMKNALLGATLLSSLGSAPPQVQQAVSKMSPEQQEYFNRPSVAWDWNKLQSDANANNVSLTEYMARSWPKITSGAYNMQPATANQPRMAQGGALSAVARFAQGAGSGRADTIDAKLSDGEYVIDAETVAMLGDGSNKEGAKRLDAMRGNIRSHKGKALAKGKFSPNAKSPLSYLKGVA
ncbi:MAG: hypothetical protein ACKO0Z_13810 [Betaproteobacteria bacterium]